MPRKRGRGAFYGRRYHTIDTGTTNTRVILWDKNRKLIGIEKREIGVRDTAIDGNNLRLKQGVRDWLADLLQKTDALTGM